MLGCRDGEGQGITAAASLKLSLWRGHKPLELPGQDSSPSLSPGLRGCSRLPPHVGEEQRREAEGCVLREWFSIRAQGREGPDFWVTVRMGGHCDELVPCCGMEKPSLKEQRPALPVLCSPQPE